jgi:hypothetical protein
MQLDLNNLPSDPELPRRLVRDIATAVDHRDTEIERLKSIIKQLQRMQFGRRSERIDSDQLALGLEDVDSDIARIRDDQTPVISETRATQPRRRALPEHLPREDVLLDVESEVCNCCGGALHLIRESVSEMLDWVPAQFRVVRTTRPKYACRACNKVVQAAAPERAIAGGMATPALLAAHSDQRILRSSSALSAVADLRSPRRRSLSLDARGMGRRGVLVARSIA